MTWTDRKHRDLERLLGQFRKELQRRGIDRDSFQCLVKAAEKHSELDWAANLTVDNYSALADGPNILDTVAMLLAIMGPEHGKKHEGDDALIVPLMWWCGIAERRHGMDRHTALCWFVQQCKDKEEKEMFRGIFGNAIVDSIARRLYQKAKADGMLALADSRQEELGRVWFDGIEGDDLYELAWKAVIRWVKGSGDHPGVAHDIKSVEVERNLPFSPGDPYEP